MLNYTLHISHWKLNNIHCALHTSCNICHTKHSLIHHGNITTYACHITNFTHRTAHLPVFPKNWPVHMAYSYKNSLVGCYGGLGPFVGFWKIFGLDTALGCTKLHCTALHCTALHCTALCCRSPDCTALYCIYWKYLNSILSSTVLHFST